MEALEDETGRIHLLRENVHRAYAEMLDLTMFGVKVLAWHPEDTLIYRGKRLAMMYSKASIIYPIVGCKDSQTSFRIRKG